MVTPVINDRVKTGTQAPEPQLLRALQYSGSMCQGTEQLPKGEEISIHIYLNV